jgi:transcription initiation factor TFIIIB Brf1 subunit/transcription initiation factor TFIIB
LDSVRGEYVCTICGLVLSKHFVPPSYKINPNNDLDSRNNGRHFVALGDRLNIVDGLGSYMGFQFSSYFHDKNGAPLSSKKQALYKRLKYRYDLRARIDKKETNYRTLMIFNRVCTILEPLNLNLRNRAAYLYQKFIKVLKKGDFYNHLNLIAVCLYLAVKESKNPTPLTIKEIANAFKKLNHRVSTKSIIRTALQIKPKFMQYFQNHKPSKSEDYLSKIINKVISYPEIKSRLKKIAKSDFQYAKSLNHVSLSILQMISNDQRGGRNPYILAAATVYAADQKLAKNSKHRPILTQHLLSIITETAEYSLRDHWRGLLYNFVC